MKNYRYFVIVMKRQFSKLLKFFNQELFYGIIYPYVVLYVVYSCSINITVEFKYEDRDALSHEGVLASS